MSIPYQLDTDLNEAHAMAQVLETYVRGNELYGNTGGGFFSKMPSLTIGALILRLRRLQLLREYLVERQQTKLDEALLWHESVQNEWRVHYTEKAHREMVSRIDAMQTFFRECADNPRTCPNIYKPEVMRRTVVQELIMLCERMGELLPEGFENKLKGADNQLRGIVQPADFMWAEDLTPAYPREVFWWLYYAPPNVEE